MANVARHLARLVPRKGIDNVIRALACLRKRVREDARLYVVARNTDEPDERATPEIARLGAIARDEGVQDFVTFVGRRDRPLLHLYYQAADVFVTTPWYEPFASRRSKRWLAHARWSERPSEAFAPR